MGGAEGSGHGAGGVQVSGASMVGLSAGSQHALPSANTGMLTPVAAPRPSGGSGTGGGAMDGTGGGASGSPGNGGAGAGASQWGLRERVVAVESLMYMATELRAAKNAIIVSGNGGRVSVCVCVLKNKTKPARGVCVVLHGVVRVGQGSARM